MTVFGMSKVTARRRSSCCRSSGGGTRPRRGELYISLDMLALVLVISDMEICASFIEPRQQSRLPNPKRMGCRQERGVLMMNTNNGWGPREIGDGLGQNLRYTICVVALAIRTYCPPCRLQDKTLPRSSPDSSVCLGVLDAVPFASDQQHNGRRGQPTASVATKKLPVSEHITVYSLLHGGGCTRKQGASKGVFDAILGRLHVITWISHGPSEQLSAHKWDVRIQDSTPAVGGGFCSYPD
ncbi:hypothetical protein QBC40DRAFT_106891 [Triangularia verruculosa]|uniref:Uncharacterized protein n=1 Tax=Triangularia verruculosa TaxID=2587418 RepID=A0AAN7AS86_9PEZI|nr:hypothetical protein QBC40DRAFT_106891 [Triangularia verruculosa]